MEKNINGTPIRCRTVRASACPCLSEDIGGATRPPMQGNGNTGGSVGGTEHDYSCGGDGSCLDAMPLAYVYAPSQKFRMLYSANEALKHGTLFEELYKPMEVYGRE